MTRSSLSRIARALAVGFVVAFAATAARAEDRPSALTAEDRAELARYAADTWKAMDRLTYPSGLPSDRIRREGDGWREPVAETSPTNIAAYIWSVLGAERLGIIAPGEAGERLSRTLRTLQAMERPRGFFLNDIDPRDGRRLEASPVDGSPRRPLISTVDNAWLAAALTLIANARPDLAPSAAGLLDGMDFAFLYDPYDAADPVARPGQFRVGYWVDDGSFFGHYGLLNSEARIASYLAIARGQIPADHYYRMHRTLPTSLVPQAAKPTGEIREYLGVSVFEGAQDHLGRRVVPSWGGSMFEALMVTLFVPEAEWAPRSWGVNHPLYARGQIEHGLIEMNYGYWGFSPSFRPTEGYETYGVKGLGANPHGYYSFDIPWAPSAIPPDTTRGVVTPHAAFLALPFAPRAAMDNLAALRARFPIYGPLGFQDSVDVGTGTVSGYVLALDQGMIMAAAVNELTGGYLREAFASGRFEAAIRPLIAQEEFTAGEPGGDLAGRRLEPQITRLEPEADASR